MSSINAVSSLAGSPWLTQSNSSQPSNSFGAFQQLAESLQSGDLSGAQQAYNTIAAIEQNSPNQGHNTAAASAFSALGQALQAGNLPAAQQAFSSLHQDLAGVHGFGGHHHHGGGEVQSAPNVADSLFSSPSNSTTTNNDSGTNSQTNSATNLLDLLT